ncbi:MAG: DUF3617 domain-containing protein, partial [Sphingomicrobium sp.]
FTMGGGKIDAVMHCGDKQATQDMQLAGTYSPDNYQLQMSTKMQGGSGQEGSMSMKMRVEAKRVGECSAKKA